MGQIRFREDRGFWVASYVDNQGKRHQVKAGRVKAQAQETLNRILADLHKEKVEGTVAIKDLVFSEYVKEYRKYSEKNKRASTYKSDGCVANRLESVFGQKKLSQITVKDVQLFKDKLSSEVSLATVNRHLALLKNMYTKAIEWDYAKENPVKKVKLFKENNARIRYLNQTEYKNLLIHCDKRIKPIVTLALQTGMRKGELLALTWNDVDLEKRSIHVRFSKNGEGRHIPMSQTAKDTLEELSKIRHINNQFVFYGLTNLRKLWEKAVKDASIQDYHFHDNRHSFASYSMMSGMDIKTLQEVLGHKTLAMTMRYAHLAQSHKLAAVQRMDQYLNDIGNEGRQVQNSN